MKIHELPTPYPVIGHTALVHNLDTMAKACGGLLRPHYKSHKCGVLAKAQMQRGAVGMTCATVSEAEDLARHGVENILLANDLATPDKLDRFAALARERTVSLCASSSQELALLSGAAVRNGVTLGVYVELDVGLRRMGVATAEEAAALVSECDRPGLEFRGIQAYAGQLSHLPSPAERIAGVKANEEALRQLAALLEKQGIRGYAVSGGSTGTALFKARAVPTGDADLDGSAPVYTELQAGSYLLGDTNYAPLYENGLPFRCSLTVLTTVLGVYPDRVITDAGVKALAVDQGMPGVAGRPDAVVALHEEHGLLQMADSGLHAGDRLRMLPSHCCSTMKLFDRAAVADGEDVLGFLEITAR